MLWLSVVRASPMIIMFDNLVVDSASCGMLITKLCTDSESWHQWGIDLFDM
jgi:hypothetical protein